MPTLGEGMPPDVRKGNMSHLDNNRGLAELGNRGGLDIDASQRVPPTRKNGKLLAKTSWPLVLQGGTARGVTPGLLPLSIFAWYLDL